MWVKSNGNFLPNYQATFKDEIFESSEKTSRDSALQPSESEAAHRTMMPKKPYVLKEGEHCLI